MQIVVRQISGLGNQLFQYAAGRYYAKVHAATMRMCVDPERNAVSHGYKRPFLLSHLSIPNCFKEMTPFERLLFTNRKTLKPISAAAKSMMKIAIFREPFDERYSFLERIPLDPKLRTVYLLGYWQNYKIVDAVAEELRLDLTFKEGALGQNLDALNEIRRCSEPVALHIRRGDYTLAAEGDIALPIEYYVRSIRKMRERLQDPVFFVFSDDMDFARAHLAQEQGMVFLDHNDASTSHEDLRLMSSCRHHIIANSTFSWWGAWLNPREEKIVLAPRNWLRAEGSYFPDLLPPEWTLVDA